MSNENNEFRDKIFKAYNAEVKEALKKVNVVGLDGCSDILRPIRDKYMKMAMDMEAAILMNEILCISVQIFFLRWMGQITHVI